ncbi:MAG: aminotransferase class V-fold PLP-dependent enzyme [Myxococcota bacterium]
MIYLDHAATSPLLPEVLDAMGPWLGAPANPASVHALGRRAAAAVDGAREQIAALLGRPAAGIVLCSGATEANHTALRGLRAAGAAAFWAAPIEHPSVRTALEAAGAPVHALGVGLDGVVRLDPAPGADDALVLMAVNHETGVRQPIAAAAALGRRLHVDATQALGKGAVPGLDQADTVAVSAHKIGGPAGVGALSLRSGEPFPALFAGSQERGRRGGTVNVAGAVGFGEACRLAARDEAERLARWARLAERLRAGLAALGTRPVGDPARAVPSITTVVFPGIAGDAVVQALDLAGVAASSGAACASGAVGPSPVLAAMGEPEPAGGLRISFGPATSDADVDAALAALADAVPRIREASAWD